MYCSHTQFFVYLVFFLCFFVLVCVYVYICVCIQIFLWIWWSANILFLVFAHFFSFKCCISFFFSYSVHYQYLWLFLVPITVTADFFCVAIHFWFPFSDFFIDCSLFVFYSSILGMNLFGCKFCRILSSGRRKCDRKNFDSLLWAIVTVFQVLLAPWALLTPINPFCKSFPLPLPCMLINIVPPPPPPTTWMKPCAIFGRCAEWSGYIYIYIIYCLDWILFYVAISVGVGLQSCLLQAPNQFSKFCPEFHLSLEFLISVCSWLVLEIIHVD